MKVDLSNGSSLSCQFYYTYQICEYFLLLRRKKLLCSDIVNFWGVEIPKLNIVFKGVSEGGRMGGGVENPYNNHRYNNTKNGNLV